MSQERLEMSLKERQRMLIMHQVESGELSLIEASERMGICYRQSKRIWLRWKLGNAGGLIHRLRGQFSNRALPPEFKKGVLDLYRENFKDFGPTLASEKLEELFDVSVNRETLRRWLHQDKQIVPRCRLRAHRSRRARRKHFGELVQFDGSDHAWFEDRGDKSCLFVMVDDATGQSLSYMSPAETTKGAFTALRLWIEAYGIPSALYLDKRTVYRATREPNEQERREGTGALTDFGRACHLLGIDLIFAHSPQAKGRVERKNGVYQDRLVKEMRLLGIDDIDGANAILGDFDKSLNGKIAVLPASDVDFHRPTPSGDSLNEILCREATRVVQNDWTISFKSLQYQIKRQPGLPRPKSRVIVRRRQDDSLTILCNGKSLDYDVVKLLTDQLPHPHGGGAPPRACAQTDAQTPLRGHF